MVDPAKTFNLNLDGYRPSLLSAIDVTVVNTVAETDLFSFNLPTDLAVGDILELVIGGTVFNNTAGNVNFTFKWYLGGTAYTSTGALAIPTSTGTRQFMWRVHVLVVAPAASQHMHGNMVISAASTSSVHPMSTTLAFNGAAGSKPTKDLTAVVATKATVTMGTADANAQCVLDTATLAVLKR